MSTAIQTFVLVFGISGHGPPTLIKNYGTRPECEVARLLVLSIQTNMYAICVPGPVKVH